jgi:gluconokinase
MASDPAGANASNPPSELRRLPSVLLLMGAAGSGKTTIGQMLSRRLGWEFRDGDSFHPPANIAKMSAGIPLDDEDRWPWLRAIRNWIDDVSASGRHGIVASSALKRAYREVLAGTSGEAVALVFLKGSKDLIAGRMAKRRDHFMPPALLDSQFAILEEPGPDERPIIVSIEPSPEEIVRAVLANFVDHPCRSEAEAAIARH